jgi:hypothetical protein
MTHKNPERTPAVSRRGLLAGAGAAGAAVVAVTALRPAAPVAPTAVAAAEPVADEASGYRLSAHVKRYYQTARV